MNRAFSGGSTSEAFIHGFNHWPEAVRQLRGTAVNKIVGYETLRFTWDHVVNDPDWVVRALRLVAFRRVAATS